MPTQAQVNANRLNAQKSTGPTTPAGEAISSLNALKSGIDAWSHIIPRADPTEFEALTTTFVHYQPADPTQLSLVDTLISAEWIQRRLRPIEAQLWNYQIECLDNNLSHADFLDASIQHNSPLGHAFHAPRSLFPHSAPHLNQLRLLTPLGAHSKLVSRRLGDSALKSQYRASPATRL